MEEFKDYWNDCHIKYNDGTIIYDNWIDKYLPYLNKEKIVLELGSGLGNDSKYLLEKGFKVISTDYSDVALKNIQEKLPAAKVMCLNLTEAFPFKDNSFNLVVADLCLHYFNDIQTKEIMKEIKRVLSPNGILLARVNSTQDLNHGAGQGEKLEENFYFVDGYNKRFFNSNDVHNYFDIIGKTSCHEDQMLRYSKPKNTIEIISICDKTKIKSDLNFSI